MKMMELASATDNRRIDIILVGIAGMLEIVFPAEIWAITLPEVMPMVVRLKQASKI